MTKKPAVLARMQEQGDLSPEEASKLKKAWGATIPDKDTGKPKAVYIRKPEAIGHEWIHWVIDKTAGPGRASKLPDKIYVAIEDRMRPHGVIPVLRQLLKKRGYRSEDYTYEYLPWLFDMMTRPTRQFRDLFPTEETERKWQASAKTCWSEVKKWAANIDPAKLK